MSQPFALLWPSVQLRIAELAWFWGGWCVSDGYLWPPYKTKMVALLGRWSFYAQNSCCGLSQTFIPAQGM